MESVHLQMDDIKQDIQESTSGYLVNTSTPNTNLLGAANYTIKYIKAFLQPLRPYPEPPVTPISQFFLKLPKTISLLILCQKRALPTMSLPLHPRPTRSVLLPCQPCPPQTACQIPLSKPPIFLHTSTWQAKGIAYLNSRFYTNRISKSWTLTLDRNFSNWTTYRRTYITSFLFLNKMLSHWRYPKLYLSIPIWYANRIT